jgi:hypothetical protein
MLFLRREPEERTSGFRVSERSKKTDFQDLGLQRETAIPLSLSRSFLLEVVESGCWRNAGEVESSFVE